MPKLVYDVVFNIDQSEVDRLDKVSGAGTKRNTKKTVSDVKKEQSAIQQLNSTILNTANLTERAEKAVQEFAVGGTGSISTLDSSMNRFGQTVKDTGRNVNRTGKSFASANQLVFSFSDGIQDASQFSQGFSQGMRAVGNNISFTAELLGVTARNAKDAGISMREALGKAITPVTGAILALNVVMAGSQILMDTMGKSSREAANDLDELLSASSALRGMVGEDFLGIREIESQIKILERQSSAIDEIIDAKRFQEETVFQTVDQVTAAQERLSGLEEQYGITADRAKNLNKQLKENLKRVKDLRDLASLDPLSEFVLSIEERLAPAIKEFNAGLAESPKKLKGFAGETQQLIFDIRRGDADLLEAIGISEEDSADAILFLQKKLKELEDFIPEPVKVPIKIPEDNIISIESQLLGLDLSPIIQTVDIQVAGPTRPEDLLDLRSVNTGLPVGSIARLEQEKAGLEEKFRNASLQAERDAVAEKIRLKEKEIRSKNSLEKQGKEFGKQQILALTQVAGQAAQALFGDTKSGAIASAVVNAGNAIVRQFSDLPLAAAIPASGIVAASTIKQIQRIKNTDFGDSGNTSASGSSGSSSGIISSSDVERPTQSITFNPRSPQASNQGMTVQVVNTFDKKTAAKVVREGETQIKNSQKKVVTSA